MQRRIDFDDTISARKECPHCDANPVYIYDHDVAHDMLDEGKEKEITWYVCRQCDHRWTEVKDWDVMQ